MAEEQWRPVVGYEGLYEVSDQGRVRSLDKVVNLPADGGRHPSPYSRYAKGRVLKPCPTSRGYLSVALYRDNRPKSHLVQHLVTTAFLGPRPEGMQVCHGPAGKGDNSLVNLCYGTASKNNGEDKRRDGTAPIGEANPRSKLTEEDARTIIQFRGYLPQQFLAMQYGVSIGTIRSIQQGRTWSHLHKINRGNDLDSSKAATSA